MGMAGKTIDSALIYLKQNIPVSFFILYLLKDNQFVPLVQNSNLSKDAEKITKNLDSFFKFVQSEEQFKILAINKKASCLISKITFKDNDYFFLVGTEPALVELNQDKLLIIILNFKLRIIEFLLIKEKGALDEFFRNLLDTVPFSIFISNLKGEILQINSLALNLSKYSETEIKLLRISDITKSANKNPEHIRLSEIRQADQLLFGTILIAKDGEEIPVSVTSQFISNTDTDFFISFVQKMENAKELESKIFKNILEIQNNERKRISRDLHDGLGPLLSLIKLYVSDLDSDDFSNQQRKSLVNDTVEIIDEAVSTTRSIANNLVPSVLKQYGLVNALSEFIHQIRRKNNINIELKSKGKDLLDINVQMEVYQIIRELLNNSLKHAKATQIIIKLLFFDNHLNIHYKDNGIGFNLDNSSISAKGLGLSNIYSRIEVLKGDLKIETKPGNGLWVEIKI